MTWSDHWDVPFRYVFSGSLTSQMQEYLRAMNDFKPFNVLVSQVDKSGLKQAIEWKKNGFAQWSFCDSGAFSVHTGKAQVTQDDYIELITRLNDDFDVFAQLDTIPGEFKKAKSAEDYVNSAESSWENFLYMRERVPDKTKIMPVFHFGEDMKYLARMLDYVDSDGDKLDYIGLSPANDASVQDRMLYLQNMFDFIHASSNPNVRTHVYGFTSLTAMSKYPCYSADSISHRLLSGYNKLYTQEWGIVSTSIRSRSTKAKSNLSFLETADDYNIGLLRKELESLGVTPEFAHKFGKEYDDVLEWIPNDHNIRVAISMKNIQILCETKYKYKESNLTTQKKLF